MGERVTPELAYSFGAIIHADRDTGGCQDASIGMSIFW